MNKTEALGIIFRCADLYEQNLCNRTLLIISSNNSGNRVIATEIQFDRTNFMHLTGIKFEGKKRISPDSFYTLCLNRRLQSEQFDLAPDGTTVSKLRVLPAMLGKCNLGANMIGDYYDQKPKLITEKLAGNVRGCIGIVYDEDRESYFPNTVLNLDMRHSIRNQQRIIATYRKQKGEDTYSELVYRASKFDLLSVKYPEPFQYLNAPIQPSTEEEKILVTV